MKTFIVIKIILVGFLVIFALTPKKENCTYEPTSKANEVNKSYTDTASLKLQKKLDSMLVESKEFKKKCTKLKDYKP